MSNNDSVPTNGNTTNGNTNTLSFSTPTPVAVTNNAPTLTPMIKAYCEALNKGDEATVRKTYSADTLAIFAKEMKEEKATSLTKFLNEYDKVGGTCELTNEQISGDTATAVFKTDSYKTGLPIVFVKEGGEWKLTNKSPVLDSMKRSNSSNSNAGK
ncbi:MAG TPA: hypothetical protein VGI80_05190 [Pyrinomonadaceae bacterium]